MRYLSVKNLSKYQHYKHRNPPWIKMYREVWTDYTLRSLSVAERLLFLGMTSLGMEMSNQIPHDPTYLTSRLGFRITKTMIEHLLLSSLILSNLISSNLEEHNASAVLADCKHVASIDDDGFEQFWSVYPRKIGKREALKSWGKAINRPNITVIVNAIAKAKESGQWTRDNGQFIPYPATWLNQCRWDDEVTSTGIDVVAYLKGGES